MKRFAWWAAAWAALAIGGSASAQGYPARPINMVVPFAAGGIADSTARPFAEFMAKALKQPVVVQNRGGAGGAVGTGYAAVAKPDGYTVLFTVATISAVPEAERLNGRKPPYELSQFAPVGLLSAEPLVLIARADARWTSAKDLADEARKKPGAISYGSSGAYGPAHLSAEMFASAAGIKLQHIPFTGAAPAMSALLGGHIDVSLSAMASAVPYVQAGTLKALATFGTRRSPELPDVPTFKELGIDVEFANWAGLFVPAGTPPEAVNALRSAMREVAKSPEFIATMKKIGLPIDYLDAPAFADYWKEDARRLTTIVKQLGPVQ
ncbi:MAG: tripartite tricarboxylate transporter substrate binding protein [Gammaproteobacteria bacterium]|nr:tripartite tricarboxylate transporter substrate binding protein [Gammaproteobacteria bacterium]MBU1444143.1 tripartite tricarboxylate transporter substrate binding protein [Gammaproteobacteria bacterium]MBU2408588.1 tripartite tricarboxylate transporter substrate binding protein [Gammaproteobacteria bacterium]